MIRPTILKTIASFAFSLAATAAFAHAQLQKAVPAVGGVAAGSPKEIRLKFSEGVEPRFSTIGLAAQDGVAQPIDKVALDPTDASTLVAKIEQPLKPGVYKVTWRAVSVNSHKTQGVFTFTVAP